MEFCPYIMKEKQKNTENILYGKKGDVSVIEYAV